MICKEFGLFLTKSTDETETGCSPLINFQFQVPENLPKLLSSIWFYFKICTERRNTNKSLSADISAVLLLKMGHNHKNLWIYIIQKRWKLKHLLSLNFEIFISLNFR